MCDPGDSADVMSKSATSAPVEEEVAAGEFGNFISAFPLPAPAVKYQ
jgi:hypothetical protein